MASDYASIVLGVALLVFMNEPVARPTFEFTPGLLE